MSDYIRGLNRQQQLLFSERLEDYLGENDPVRVIDALGLDLLISGGTIASWHF